MTRDTIWQTAAVSEAFLENVRGAIPLATEQIDVMLRVIQAARPSVANFLDLGCGDGILGQAILKKYPRALGVFLDFSESMIEAARNRCGPRAEKREFITQDFGKKEWVNSVGGSPFDVIVSGFAIHHQSDVRKKEIYREIYHLLKPGGIFLNLEHVSSSSELGSEISDELFIAHLVVSIKQKVVINPENKLLKIFITDPTK